MDEPEHNFETPAEAEKHFRALCTSLQSQLTNAIADADDYADSSAQFQAEMERDLATMEKTERVLQRELEILRSDKDEWKNKHSTSLREHTATMMHMQKELESLRISEKATRTMLRDIELDNDDLQRGDREKESSLQDLDTRYGASMERIALLEQELVNKASLQEEVQRLKDELRDINEELSVLRSQVTTYPAPFPRPLTPPGTTNPARSSSTNADASRSSNDFLSPQSARASLAAPLVRARTMSQLTPPPARTYRPSLSFQTAPDFVRTTRPLAMSINISTSNGSSKAEKEKRIEKMDEMKDRTAKFRDALKGSSMIPRSSMSPARLSKSVRRPPGQSALGMSVGPGLPRARNTSRASSATEDGEDQDVERMPLPSHIRPPSRSGLRASMGMSSLPVRSSSRMGNNLGASSSGIPTPISSRPMTPMTEFPRSTTPTPIYHQRSTTPVFHGRPSTPVGHRPAWGSTTPAPPLPTKAKHLSSSIRPRTSSVYGNTKAPASVSMSSSISGPRESRRAGSLDLRRPSSHSPEDGKSATVGMGNGVGVAAAARRASLALKTSIMQRGSLG